MSQVSVARRLSAPPTTVPTSASLPRWCELAAVLPAVALASLGGTALVLAMTGTYSLALALMLGLPLTVIIGAVAVRASRPRPPVRRADVVGALGALII